MEVDSSVKKKILLSDDKEEEEEHDGDVEPMQIDTKVNGTNAHAAISSATAVSLTSQDVDGTVDDLFDISDPMSASASSIANTVSTATVAATSTLEPTASKSISPSNKVDQRALLHDLFSPSFQNNPFLSSCSDRFRSALARVRISPTTDIEAWQALLTEVQISFRHVHASSGDDPDKNPKLDFIEACYGALLLHFPYSSLHLVQILEILYTISALPAEEGGSHLSFDYQHMKLSPRQMQAEMKMECIFQNALGIRDYLGDSENPMEGSLKSSLSNQTTSLCTQGMNMSCVDLWLIYIKKRTRDATRKAYPPSQAMMPNPPISNPEKYLRDAITEAYKKTLDIAYSIPNCHLLWRRYLTHVRSWNLNVANVEDPNNPNAAVGTTTDPTLANEQMLLLRKMYQKIVSIPMSNLEEYWREYEQFERNLSDVLAQVLLTEHLPSYQHARGVYLERARYINDISSTSQPSSSAVAQQKRWAATPPKVSNAEDIAAEHQVLAKFRARCAYERTNPERKARMNKDMVRQVYKEMVCAFMRHPEVWHEWAMWELLSIEDVTATAVTKEADKNHDKSVNAYDEKNNTNIANCIQVFELARKHIPDCALLTISQAEVMEVHGKNPRGAMKILQHFVSYVFPCALGYVTLQKMVRRYDGIAASRKIFSRARRYLCENVEDKKETGDNEDSNPSTRTSSNTATDISAPSTAISLTDEKSSMVKSRMDKKIGDRNNRTSLMKVSTPEISDTNLVKSSKNETNERVVKLGVMTWHVYACHATIEHRLNSLPLVAARIYELGLRKHKSFLSTPAYVLQYADLLWELNETENLRALLNRSIAACEEHSSSIPTSSRSTRSLWDAMLKLECAKGNSLERIRKVEASRRKALFDDLDLDFTADLQTQTGTDFVNSTTQDSLNHKTLIETLTRIDGYENAALIGNGLGRMLDRFELMGAFGEGAPSSQLSLSASTNSTFTTLNPFQDAAAAGGGGPPDLSFAKRVHHLLFQHHLTTTITSNINGTTNGASNTNTTAGIGSTPNTLLDRSRAARERIQLQQQQQTAILTKMNSPEWIRPLISMLPPPPRFQRGGIPIMQKPLPHLVEMALAFLKSTPMPERPQGDDDVTSTTLNRNGITAHHGNKRARIDDSYSSDEDGEKKSSSNGAGGAGYGNQFRARQRARQVQSLQQTLSQNDRPNGDEEQQANMK